MEAVFEQGANIKNRYIIKKIMGSSSIGTTYLARDKESKKYVVLKVISLSRLQEWKKLELFERQAALLGKLDHPAIPHYIDYFEIKKHKDNFYVLVQEYIEGISLWDAVKQKKRFTAAEVASIFKNLLSILHHIHNMKPVIVHRDINPKNIFLDKDNKIYLVDFGAARITEYKKADGDTIVGSIGYSAPEQLYGRSAPASDLYSLAVTIIFLLTGQEPSAFKLKNVKLDYHPFVNISGKLTVILDLMLEPELEKRIEDARTILDYLEDKKAAVSYINKKSGELKIRLKEPPKDYLEIFRRREKWQKLKTIFFSGMVLAVLLFIDMPLKQIYIQELYLFFSIFLILLKVISVVLVWNIIKNYFFIELETLQSVKRKAVLIKATIIFVLGLILNFLDMAVVVPIYIHMAFSVLAVIVILGQKKIKQLLLLIIFVPLFSWLGIAATHFFIWLLLSYLFILFICKGQARWLGIIPAAGIIIILLTNVTAYYMAAESNHIKSEPETALLFKLPYTLGADVNFRLDMPILCALSTGRKVDIAEYLVQRGARIELTNDNKSTPLHIASWRSTDSMFEYLLSRQPDINSVNYYGRTPLTIAADNGDMHKLELLIKNDADITIGYPLHNAVSLNHLEATAYLLEHNADINKQDKSGYTPLHHAARIKDNIDIIRLLLEKGALPDIKNLDQKTPLDLARENNNDEVVKLLTSYENK